MDNYLQKADELIHNLFPGTVVRPAKITVRHFSKITEKIDFSLENEYRPGF